MTATMNKETNCFGNSKLSQNTPATNLRTIVGQRTSDNISTINSDLGAGPRVDVQNCHEIEREILLRGNNTVQSHTRTILAVAESRIVWITWESWALIELVSEN